MYNNKCKHFEKWVTFLTLSEIEPRFFGHSGLSLVTTPTELSRFLIEVRYFYEYLFTTYSSNFTFPLAGAKYTFSNPAL